LIKQPFEGCSLVKPREMILAGRAASIGKINTQNIVGKPEEMKPCRKYVSVGGRAILKCTLRNGV